jgi:hypothetical protein
MTWLGDRTNRVSDTVRAPLLEERELLIKEIHELKSQPIKNGALGLKFRQEDLLALAKKVTDIDKKLGRLIV